MSDRMPVVAGQFYPSNAEKLSQEVKKYLKTEKQEKVVAVVSPHAGYVYSGHVAGAVFSKTKVPETVIILSANHSGQGSNAAVMTSGNWIIPTGKIPIETKLAKSILEKSDILEEDAVAHQHEHSLEVQLPLLKEITPDVKIVPICLSHLSSAQIEEIGKSIADAIKEFGEDVLIVSSSDMNHYQSAETTNKKDHMAIDQILKLDAKGLLIICAENGITMCGVIPTAIAIIAAKHLGAKTAKLVKYSHSGDVSGDNSSVVGYAGIQII